MQDTLSTTLQEGRQFVAQLPADIPVPEFDLFQRVQWEAPGMVETGHITGVYWIDNNCALMEHIAPGWHYVVSRIYGMTDINEILHANWEQTMLAECQITALEGGPASC